MNASQKTFERLFVPPKAGPGGSFRVGCIDRSRIAGSHRVRRPAARDLYYQLAGGANIGLPTCMAWETTSPNFLRKNAAHMEQPLLPAVSKLASTAMGQVDLAPFIHGPVCLATTYEKGIAEGAADPSKLVLDRARQFDPTFVGRAQVKAVAAAGRILDIVSFLPAEEVEQYMMGHQHENSPAIPKETLDPQLPAVAIIANHADDMFDVTGANAAETPAYCVSMGLAERISRVFPVDTQALRHAFALQMGVVSVDEHVRDATGDLLPILSRGH